MVKEKGLNTDSSLSLSPYTHTHTGGDCLTQKIKIKPGTMAEIEKVDESRAKICPLLWKDYATNQECLLDRCGWFDFENDCCAVVAVGKILNSLEEWERDRS